MKNHEKKKKKEQKFIDFPFGILGIVSGFKEIMEKKKKKKNKS